MKFCILTLFPEMFRGFVDDSILRRGQDSGAISITTKNIRDFSTDKNKKVDDALFGGGPGMLLKPEPVAGAIRKAKEENPNAKVIYLSPGGEIFDQKKAEKLANSGDDFILLCGRYEGIDQRIRATMVDEEISIGEYVLSGGEIAAAVVVDTVARLVPGVVGSHESVETESFSKKIFRCAEFPQFTRPNTWEGLEIPKVLLLGNHAEIEKWQLEHLPGLSAAQHKILTIRKDALPRKTKNLLLRNHDQKDIDFWMNWVNDEKVTRSLSVLPPLSREDEEDFFDDSQENLFLIPMSICDKKTGQPIGTAGLEVNPLNEKSATFGILIGDKNYWGKGVCAEALTEVLKIAFEELDLYCVRLDVFTDNTAAQKCYEKVGMRQVGRSQKKHLKSGVFYDAYFYEILQEEFIRS